MKKIIAVILSIIFCQSVNAQVSSVSVSGKLADRESSEALAYVNVVLLKAADSSFVTGTISNETGQFTMSATPGDFLLKTTYIGYRPVIQNVFIGSKSPFIDLGEIQMAAEAGVLDEVVVRTEANQVADALDKKTFTLAENVSQLGGSVLQAVQNLPGVTAQDGKLLLRGNDKVIILIDGKQTALTGFNGQSGLDNLPASAVEKIEIINNPSARYDANGNAGIINIVYKKNNKEGKNGRVGLGGGLGALWVKNPNLPGIRPQYQTTPKINPSFALNNRSEKANIYLQGDYLYTHTLNKNEFVDRYYDDGSVIRRQTKRNRNTLFTTTKAGADFYLNPANSLNMSVLFGTEKILDHGDEPFFNQDLSERLRLWQFLEDELKTTVIASGTFEHKYAEPGHKFQTGLLYTFHRENEQYFFDNIMPTFTGKDAFKLISDEQILDFSFDYTKPLKLGFFEGGVKVRNRSIPTNMQFFPGINSPIDASAGGKATYKEFIPALYGNYVLDGRHWEAEAGLRMEYVNVNYLVNPNHPTYSSNGYNYTRPFPNARLSYKLSPSGKLTLFYNARVDRPNEVDIRVFPKYDDVELIKVGNPALKPMFTKRLELGFKQDFKAGSVYLEGFHTITDATITRISSTVPGSNIIYAIFQNTNKSYRTGGELVWSQKIGSWYNFNFNATLYHNRFDAFSVTNLYPVEHISSSPRMDLTSGNIKWVNNFKFKNGLSTQISATYLAPDLIPQGRIKSRFSLDAGMKMQKGKAEYYVNATDLLNTMVTRKTIYGNGFYYNSTDYYETQVIRGGVNWKF